MTEPVGDTCAFPNAGGISRSDCCSHINQSLLPTSGMNTDTRTRAHTATRTGVDDDGADDDGLGLMCARCAVSFEAHLAHTRALVSDRLKRANIPCTSPLTVNHTYRCGVRSSESIRTGTAETMVDGGDGGGGCGAGVDGGAQLCVRHTTGITAHAYPLVWVAMRACAVSPLTFPRSHTHRHTRTHTLIIVKCARACSSTWPGPRPPVNVPGA